jgi:GNAT superfamily N-acetyltransferase
LRAAGVIFKSPDVLIRDLRAEDSIEQLTELIHDAYRRLGDLGLNYTGVDQEASVTLARAQQGHCLVAESAGTIVGTVTWYEPGASQGCDWYCRPEVAVFGQFAVSPDHQGHGVGSSLMAEVERRSEKAGGLELALDTAEPAGHLVDYYARRGYRVVDHAQWDGKTYRSVIMSKRLK